MYEPPTTAPGPMPPSEEMMAMMQQRMLYMENALTRVIRYIEDKEMNHQPEPSEFFEDEVNENW